MSDDESFIPHHDDEPAGARTPPTPAVEDSPPPSPRPQRQRLISVDYAPYSNLIYYNNYLRYSHYFTL